MPALPRTAYTMHIVICGAGYAGLTLARGLERELPVDVELTIIDESPDHLVQHELHRVIRRPSLAEEITIPLSSALERTEVRVGRIDEIDVDAQQVRFEDGRELTYDIGAICLGATTAFYGIPGVEEHATPLKRLDHAESIRAGVLGALEGDRPDPTLIVGGAGLSGVQVAGELAAVVAEEGGDATVTLIEQLDTVAPSFPPNFQAAVREALEDLGVEIRTGTAIIEADAETVQLEDGTQLAYDEFVWTGGLAGPDALQGRRPDVASDLRIADRTFVVGDTARVVDDDGQPVPPSAQTAVREARTTVENISRLVDADQNPNTVFDPRLERYQFDSPGWLVSVGNNAVAQVGPSVVTGPAALALKTTVGAGYLSSVGAVKNAVDLVAEELGLALE